MRYLKWTFILFVIIFIFLQLLANLDTLNTSLSLSLRVPGSADISINFKFLTAAIFLFAGGFIIAILIEIYSWFKYSRTIQKQQKLIQSLRNELKELKPTPVPPVLSVEPGKSSALAPDIPAQASDSPDTMESED
jgi:hypothetical protein